MEDRHSCLSSIVGTHREANLAVAEHALYPDDRRRSRIYRGLVTERQEHIFTWSAVVLVLLYATAWFSAIHDEIVMQRELARQAKAAGLKAPPSAPPTQQITAALTQPSPTPAYLTDAMLNFIDPLRGASGKLRFTTIAPGKTIATGAPEGMTSVLTNGENSVSSDFAAPESPGVYGLAVQLDKATRPIKDFSVVTLVPFAEKQRGRIGLYYLGNWPFESGKKPPKSPAYANPSGFIEVTPESADTQVSEHFRLRDFLTKDQPNVWPKYLLLNPKLVDKLELTIEELEAMGHPVRHMTIMSGFRTPEYNYTGGNTKGRANLSRHMYGDASDVFVDNDRNGAMDDLNGDRRVDARDAEVVLQAVERVERKHPELIGGVGVYSACCGHGPFTHIDVRGYRARWRGTGSG
jgi:uncharacterized protein YcbK (DUF882 family)